MAASDLKRAMRKVSSALRRLEKTNDLGRVARRNARSQVFGALRTLENAIDTAYPLEPKAKPAPDRSLLALSERLTIQGFVRELPSIAPDSWTLAEAQMFTTWVLARYPRAPVRIVVTVAKHERWEINQAFKSESIELVATHTPQKQMADLWVGITDMIWLHSPRKRTERAWVRYAYEVVQAWQAEEWRELLAPAEHH